MAHHVWTIVCRGSSIDKETGLISLFQAVERLIVDPATAEQLDQQPQDGSVALKTDLELVSRWTRHDPSIPEESSAVVHIRGPGESRGGTIEYPIQLAPYSDARVRASIAALPFTGFGRYWFVTCELLPPDDSRPYGEQREVSRVPLDVLDEPRGD